MVRLGSLLFLLVSVSTVSSFYTCEGPDVNLPWPSKDELQQFGDTIQGSDAINQLFNRKKSHIYIFLWDILAQYQNALKLV